MNFVKSNSPRGGRIRYRRAAAHLTVTVLSWCLAGCSDSVRLPTPEQWAAFEKAESIVPTIEMQRVEEARLQVGPYRVVPGDVLEFTIPALLRAVTAAEVQVAQTRNQDSQTHLCRVNEGGAIELPGIAAIEVAGLSLSQTEVAVAEAYRAHVAHRPAVFARVFEYKTCSVYVTGAVEKPGVYALRGDQMTLAHLLNEAGGIVMRDASGALMREGGGISGPGAALVRITSLEQDETRDPQSQGRNSRGPGLQTRGRVTIRDRGDGQIGFSFTAGGSHSTAGRLVLSRGARVLLEERLDLGNTLQRQVTLGKLSGIDPEFSILELEARLIAVAEQIRAGSPETKPLAWMDPQGSSSPRTPGTPDVVLPVYGLNIPVTNVALREGDTVVVERLKVPMFSVVGLVRSPGNFVYPPDIEYNLMQAVAFAGGMDTVAAPRYATIYRLVADGSIVRVPFRLVKDGEFTEAMMTLIKPGDVVALEHTPRTRANTVIHNMVRFNTGLYLTSNDLWGR